MTILRSPSTSSSSDFFGYPNSESSVFFCEAAVSNNESELKATACLPDVIKEIL
jgi:hypothetical protein